MAFIFGGNTDVKASDLPRLRDRQDRLNRMRFAGIQRGGIGGGLSALGAALAHRFGRGKVDKATELRKGELSALFGGQGLDPNLMSAIEGLPVNQQESVLGQIISGKLKEPKAPEAPDPTDDIQNIQHLAGMRDQGASQQDIDAFMQSSGMVERGVKPSDMQSYLAAEPAQRAEMEQYFAARRAPGTNVTVEADPQHFPTPPAGHAYVRHADGKPKIGPDGIPIARPIIGGPADPNVIAAKDAKFAEQTEENKSITRSSMLNQLAVAEELMEFEAESLFGVSPHSSVTGATGLLYSKIPGTPAYDFAAALDTVKANIGFDRLQRMRAASKTGAAVGQLSNRELGLLTETLAPTRQGMSPERMKEALMVIRKVYSDQTILDSVKTGEFKQPPANPEAEAALSALEGLGG